MSWQYDAAYDRYITYHAIECANEFIFWSLYYCFTEFKGHPIHHMQWHKGPNFIFLFSIFCVEFLWIIFERETILFSLRLHNCISRCFVEGRLSLERHAFGSFELPNCYCRILKPEICPIGPLVISFSVDKSMWQFLPCHNVLEEDSQPGFMSSIFYSVSITYFKSISLLVLPM